MVELGIFESLQLKRQVLLSATESAEMIVRVDEIIQSAPKHRVPDEARNSVGYLFVERNLFLYFYYEIYSF